MNRIGTIIWLIITAGSFTSCGIYSFNSGRPDNNLKTLSIHTIINQSPNLVIPALSQKFSQRLRDRFTNSTNLTLVDNNGDMDISGAITSTTVVSTAASANQTSALNQLSITVSVDLKNRKNEKESWSQSFTRFSTFSSSQSLQAIQDQLIDDIGQQLAEDIFNKALVNW